MINSRTTFYFLFIVSIFLQSCGSNKLLTGRKYFEEGGYYLAIENLREAYPKLKSKTEKAEAVYMLGVSYQKLGDYSKAAPWLKNSIRYQFPDDALPLKLAEVDKAVGKTDESISLLTDFLKVSPNNERAANCLRGIELSNEWFQKPTFYLVEKDNKLSTAGNERSISFIGDTVVIASSNEQSTGKMLCPVDVEKFADLFFSERNVKDGEWPILQQLNEPDLNTPGEESFACFSSDGRQLILVRPDNTGKDKLYYTRKTDSGWLPLKLIPFCNDGFNYLQACWSDDGKAIYFSSDRANGLGGFDIWKSACNADGEFSMPENVGSPINTSGNEIYPFERSKDVLYFSSDFHPGAGAQDIFKASRTSKGWIIRNMQVPVNSTADDMGIVFSGKGEEGFLLSNRKGSRKLDVYSFKLPPDLFMCFGKVFDNESDSIIPNVNVRISGSDGSVAKLTTSNGEFHAELLPDNDYTIIAYKKGFLAAQSKISTRGLNEGKEFQLKFRPIPTDKPIQIENIHYETGKWTLLPFSQKSLDNLVEILTINPEIKIEIGAHTDESGSDVFNEELSTKRADEVVRYLIQKGIDRTRLTAKGYGETKPLLVNARTARKYRFLKRGDSLSTEFISTLKPAEQEIARQLNRRTEFEVIND